MTGICAHVGCFRSGTWIDEDDDGNDPPPPRKRIEVGERFGRLVVIAAGRNARRWLCRCDCGNQKDVDGSHLRRGLIQSCRCLHKEISSALATTHGDSRSPEFRIWAHIIERCENACSRDYPKYGGRGIRVYPAWRLSYEAFIADVGRRPSSDHSIDRIDNDGNYEPGNVRWATRTEQARNRRSSRVLAFRGQSATVVEWAERVGLPATTIYQRLDRGWSVEETLTTPRRGYCGEHIIFVAPASDDDVMQKRGDFAAEFARDAARGEP